MPILEKKMEIKDEAKFSALLTDLGVLIQSAWNLVEDGKEVLSSRKLQGAMTKYNELIMFVRQVPGSSEEDPDELAKDPNELATEDIQDKDQ